MRWPTATRSRCLILARYLARYEFSLLHLSGKNHKRYMSEEIFLYLKVALSVLTVLKATPQIYRVPRFRSTCYSCALSICVRRSVTLWRKSTVWRQAYHLKQTKQEWRGKICQPQPSCKHYTIFSTQAPRKWKVHTAAVIIKSHKKGIRVLEIENACNVAEFSRQRASITVSVRAAKILCRGGKVPIRSIPKEWPCIDTIIKSVISLKRGRFDGGCYHHKTQGPENAIEVYSPKGRGHCAEGPWVVSPISAQSYIIH